MYIILKGSSAVFAAKYKLHGVKNMPQESDSRETYFIVGESRTNVDNAITKIYGSFFIAFEVLPATGEVLQCDCSGTLQLTNDFVRRLFVGKRLEADREAIEAEVKRRYYGSSKKAVLVAYRDALKHFQAALAEQED